MFLRYTTAILTTTTSKNLGKQTVSHENVTYKEFTS